MYMILIFLLALSLSAFAIPILMRHAAAWHLLDIPDARKIHSGMVPRIGGIAIAVSTLLTVALCAVYSPQIAGFIIGSAVIVLFGVLDDRVDLDYRIKFSGQIVAAIIAFMSGISIETLPFLEGVSLPPVIACPLTILILLGATNAFNLLDGLDGLAAGCASLSLLAIAALALVSTPEANLVVVILASLGGILGFLRYNTHPAVVYMGDAGSQFLGFVIGALAILLIDSGGGALRPALILPLLGLPVIDTAMVMLLRIREGRSPFSPDRNHIHHKLLSIGLKHHEAVGTIYLVQATIVFSAVLLRGASDLIIISTYIYICSLAALAYFWARWCKRAEDRSPSEAASAAAPQARAWHSRIRASLVVYVECSIAIYLLTGVLLVDVVIPDISLIALIGAGLTAMFLFRRKARLPAIRLALYLAAIFVSYLTAVSAIPWFSSSIFYGWIASVALAVGAIMMMTPSGRFSLSTQDFLLVLVIGGVIAFPFATIDHFVLSAILLQTIIFIYAAELLITLGMSEARDLGIIATLSLLLLALLPAAPAGWEVVEAVWNRLV